MLFFYLVVLITAGYWVVKTLGPEMAKPPIDSVRKPTSKPMSKPASKLSSKPMPKTVLKSETVSDIISNPIKIKEVSEFSNKRMEKLEMLIDEKNKSIELLQRDLRIYQAQAGYFDKVKILLENEIRQLREQNRMFRSELGLPAAQSKENSLS